jgi:pantoate--beta-alanine ligase
VVGCAIVREHDGLAMSSRNRYLTPEQRSSATVLYRALEAAHAAALHGETDAEALVRGMRGAIGCEDGVELEYAVVVDAETLSPVSVVQRSARALVAARVGSARLIDNVPIPLPGTGLPR